MKKILCAVLMLALALSGTAYARESAAGEAVLTADFMNDADLIEMLTPGDGTYSETWLYDSMVAITVYIQPAGAYEAEDLAHLLSDEPANLQSDGTTQVAGYEAARFTYTTGANEDTRANVLVCFEDGACAFALLFAIPVDYYEDYAPMTESWLASAYISYIGAQAGFTWELAQTLTAPFETDEMNTVGKLIAAYSPVNYFWMTDEEGATLLDMEVTDGTVAVLVHGAQSYLDDEQGFEGATALPAEVYGLACEFSYAVWDGVNFPLSPIAGIGVGERRENVLAAMPDAEIYAPAPEYNDFSETIECVAYSEEEAYYLLDYYVDDGLVSCVMLQYFAE